MPATIEEVKAFKAIDGKVYSTVEFARKANIRYLCDQLFGLSGDDDDEDEKRAADLLFYRLTHLHNGRASITTLQRLAKELE